MKITLRPYQEKAVNDIRAAYNNGYKAPLFVLPTGGGKTVCFSYIAHHASMKGNSVLILTHRRQLLEQSGDTLSKFGVSHGYIQAGIEPSNHKVQVASVMTLVNRLDQYHKPTLIVIDECHHNIASSWKKILNYYSDSLILGVTATPIRLDGSGLGISSGGFHDCLIEGPSVQELINQRYLSDVDVYGPPVGAQLDNLPMLGGDFIKSKMEEALDKPKIHGKAVEHYLKMCPGSQALAFCASIKAADNLAAEFNANGILSKSIHSNLSKEEQASIMCGLRVNHIKVVTSCDLIGEGIDVPAVTCGIMLRPTASLGLWLQQCGRVLRPAPGKEKAIILDHVGNVEKQGHGLPTEDREWSLNGIEKRNKQKKDEEPDIKFRTCIKCYAIYKAHLKACPQCGEPTQLTQREIEYKEGQLQKIEAARINKIKRMEIGMSKTYDDLLKIEKARGYKKGWAWFVYKSKKKKGSIK